MESNKDSSSEKDPIGSAQESSSSSPNESVSSRRQFLQKTLRATAYIAPVVYSIAATDLAAQTAASVVPGNVSTNNNSTNNTNNRSVRVRPSSRRRQVNRRRIRRR